ncbi:hypothetical protein BUALT_Bualt03G0024600 [Buddleja alternifolia]|uniref:(S)-2-hydroxy-acid oxidase n=1 Tax=Buddleja alternifolia TaxID=168488 RepID=A0AAV6XQL4_9LAMI|nr:hypothetical protein BUALT_Bualt03G0024600 [Buddleja alternifolia]
MAFLSLLLVGFLVLFTAANGGGDMEEDELFGLFEVMGSLLEDPTWAQMHPQPCTDTPWPGVECELLQETSIFHITKIHLGPDIVTPPCKNSAKISQSLQKLPYLKTLSLINCFTKTPLSLTKTLFESKTFSFLQHLTLESNPSLSGEIPSSISNLANLETLCMSQNNLSGEIPSEIGKLVNLQQLDLSHNNLSGPIPHEIGNLKKLAILDVSWNLLQEMVPSTIGELLFLEKIDLSSNKLQGRLPQELGKLNRLVLLDLSHNYLTGPIPGNISGLQQQLQYLIMEDNPLNMTLPSFIGSLIKLRELSFSGCGLAGTIFSNTFSNLTNLTALSLDNNNLNGTVPAELGMLPNMDTLNLSRNQLTGELLFSEEFINRLGQRLDIRENHGLCTNYPGPHKNNTSSRRFLQIPSCSSSIFSGASNKTLAENPDRSRNMKPVTLYNGNMSSNAHDLAKDIVLFPGELATARAASAAGTIMVLKDRNIVAQLVKRAEKTGFKVIALTVDTPRLGRREADIKNRFALPSNLTLKNLEVLDLGTEDRTNDSGLASYVADQANRSLNWKDVKWLQTITKLPILVKGVLTAEDANLAVQAGVAGIIVSNHGARQLDFVPATITALEEGRVPVFMDGGVRRGPDVFKALALGASGVFIGRPYVFALAADGEAGVKKALKMLHDEFELTMALSGCRSIKEITRAHIVTPWDAPRVTPRW